VHNLLEIWLSLEKSLKQDTSASLVKRKIGSGSDSILLLVETDSARRSFSRGVAFGTLSTPDQIRKVLPALQQLRLYVRELGAGQNHLTIFLDNPLFQEVFIALAEDLIKVVSARDSKSDIGTATIQRLKTWKHFLENCPPEGLSPQAQRGLLGELLTLNDYFLPNFSMVNTVQAWQGAERKAKDFVLNGGGIEVKTTLSKNHKKVHISNEAQLDLEGFSFLYLLHFGFDEAAKSETDLVSVVAKTRDILKSDLSALSLFEQKLRNYGYLDVHAQRYETSYTVKECDFYEVSEGFPKITAANLPEGVGDVSYSIIISDCGRFRRNTSDVLNAIRDKEP
jgi:hypothetical protein